MAVSNVVESLEEAETPLFVTHRHADRNSLGSAIGLRAAFGRGTVCAPNGVLASVESLLEATDIDPLTDPDPAEFGGRHADTSAPLRAGSIDDVEAFVIAFLEGELGTMFREVTP